jgi:hypothetical protein
MRITILESGLYDGCGSNSAVLQLGKISLLVKDKLQDGNRSVNIEVTG